MNKPPIWEKPGLGIATVLIVVGMLWVLARLILWLADTVKAIL